MRTLACGSTQAAGRWVAFAVALVGLCSCAGAEVRLICMPSEPQAPEMTDREQARAVREFVRQHREVLDDNTPAELQTRPKFARSVLGQRVLLKLTKEFVDQTGIAVRVEFVEWPYAYQTMVTRAKAQDGRPLVVQLGTTWVATLADEGLLQRLDELIDRDQYPQWILRVCGYKGRLWAIPATLDPRFIYYWRRGLDGRTLVFTQQDFEDWGAFEQACQRVRDMSAKGQAPAPLRGRLRAPLALSSYQDFDLLHNLSMWVFSAGGDIVAGGPDGGSMLTHEPAVATVHWLSRLSWDGLLDLPDAKNDDVFRAFTSGRYATTVAGTWGAKLAEEHFAADFPGRQWDEYIGVELPPPRTAGQPRRTFEGGSVWAMMCSGAPRAALGREARRYLEYLGQAGVATELARAIGHPAALISAEPYHLPGIDDRVVRDALSFGKTYPALPGWADSVEQRVVRDQLYVLWKQILGCHPSLPYPRSEVDYDTRQRALDETLVVTSHRMDELLFQRPPAADWVGLLAAALCVGLGFLCRTDSAVWLRWGFVSAVALVGMSFAVRLLHERPSLWHEVGAGILVLAALVPAIPGGVPRLQRTHLLFVLVLLLVVLAVVFLVPPGAWARLDAGVRERVHWVTTSWVSLNVLAALRNRLRRRKPQTAQGS